MSRDMRNKLFLVTALVAIGAGCQPNNNDVTPDATNYGEEVSELTANDCKTIAPPPMGQPGCPQKGANDAAMCAKVKTVALAEYEKTFGKKPDCSEGWVFGPDKLNTSCIKDSKKNICKLSAANGPAGAAGWPANNNWSQCLNDWVVHCTATQPAAMGIKPAAPVCFHSDIKWGDLPADKVTAREACQSLTPTGALPPLCNPNFCKPKAKPATKKTTKAACSFMGDGSGSSCGEETSSCEACDPATDADCSYDTSCGCVACDPGDDDPACSEDLVCETPTPTPTPDPTEEPTIEPTVEPTIEPTPDYSPTPDPTVEPTVQPTVSPTATPTIEPTPWYSPTPYPTPYATPYPTPTWTPYPTPDSTPSF
jgi:hypothetical protein